MAKQEKITRQKIVDSAFQILEQGGYQALSMRNIAKKAGIAQSVIYYYFQNKKEIIASLLLKLSDDINKKSQTSIKGLDTKKALEKIIYITFKNGRHFATSFWGDFENEIKLDKTLMKIYEIRNEILNKYFSTITHVIQQGIRHQEIRRVDPRQICLTIAYQIKGYGVIRWKDNITDKEMRDFAKHFTNLLFNGIKNK